MPLSLNQLIADYAQFSFIEAETSAWSPSERAIYYEDPDNFALILHELGHGLLGHTDYQFDIELVKMEREAWEKASEIAESYSETIDEADIQTHLDTYREWLHARSLCPKCENTGIQESRSKYRCLACRQIWRVNEAKKCGLKRYAWI